MFSSLKILMLVIMAGLSAKAQVGERDCRIAALIEAKQNTYKLSRLHHLDKVEARRPYLSKYQVVFVDNMEQPKAYEVVSVEMMKSDCTVVSVKSF